MADLNELAEQEHKELVESYGGKAVGLTFNPSGLLAVEVIKTNTAEIINDLDQSRKDSTNPGERGAMLTLAIRKYQEAQMWAVKATTWTD